MVSVRYRVAAWGTTHFNSQHTNALLNLTLSLINLQIVDSRFTNYD